MREKLTGQLHSYYDEVISVIRDAESILIFGPGEAKGERKKRLERDKLGEHIEALETVDEMTDRQIAAKVRKYFQKLSYWKMYLSISELRQRRGRV